MGVTITTKVKADALAGFIDRDGSPTPAPFEPAIASAGIVIPKTPDDEDSKTKIPDEDKVLAEQIISMTLNAAPTPAKPKLSLSERTRQSIAFASPSRFQGLRSDESPRIYPPSAAVNNQVPQIGNTTAKTTTLLERTRQSISLLPSNPNPNPHASRKSSMHVRRTSQKIYLTKPFETPRKQQLMMGKGLTPPEELFTPGAGYESVFKSRPKVAVSPVGTPEPDGGVDGVDGVDGEGRGSPID